MIKVKVNVTEASIRNGRLKDDEPGSRDFHRHMNKEKVRRIRVQNKGQTSHAIHHIGGSHGQDNYVMHAQHPVHGHVGELSFNTHEGHTNVGMLGVKEQHRRNGYGSRMMHELYHWHKKQGNTGKVRYGYTSTEGEHMVKSLPYSAQRESIRLEDIPIAGGDLADLQRGGTPLKVKVKRSLKAMKRVFTINRKKKEPKYIFRPTTDKRDMA